MPGLKGIRPFYPVSESPVCKDGNEWYSGGGATQNPEKVCDAAVKPGSFTKKGGDGKDIAGLFVD